MLKQRFCAIFNLFSYAFYINHKYTCTLFFVEVFVYLCVLLLSTIVTMRSMPIEQIIHDELWRTK